MIDPDGTFDSSCSRADGPSNVSTRGYERYDIPLTFLMDCDKGSHVRIFPDGEVLIEQMVFIPFMGPNGKQGLLNALLGLETWN